MKSKVFLFGLILFLATLGQVASDLYLPSLPAIAQALAVPIASIQFSISIYMLGFACSQLIYGPLSDGLGRRLPLLIGLIILVIGSYICVAAPTIHWLLLGRFLQGLGAGSGFALSRAILRDLFSGTELASYGSYLAIGNITIMAGAPLLGGYLQYFLGWRASFIVLFIGSLLLLILVLCYLPETNQHKHHEHLKFTKILANLQELFSSVLFVKYAVIVLLNYAGITAWLTVGPVLIQTTYHFSPIEFGWAAVGNGAAYAVGSFINGCLLQRYSLERLIRLGSIIMCLGGFAMISLPLLHLQSFMIVLAPTAIFTLGVSFVFANAFSKALTPFPKIAGIAGSIFGFTEILGGVLCSGLLAHFAVNSTLLLGAVLALISLLVALIL